MALSPQLAGTLALAAVAASAAALGAITSGAPLYACALTAAVAVLATALTSRRVLAFLLLACAAGIAVAYTQATQGALPSSVKSVTDAVLLGGVLFVLPLRKRLTQIQQRAAAALLLLTGASVAAGMLGGEELGLSLLGSWQDCRWIGAIGIGIVIGDMLSPSQRRIWAFRMLLALTALNVLVSLYQVRAHEYMNTRLGFPEVSGLFGQTTADALAATALLVFVLCEWRVPSAAIRKSEMRLALATGVLGLLLSSRFKPALALLAVAAFLYLQQVGVRPLALATIAAAVPIAISFSLSWGTPHVRAQLPNEATASIAAHAMPRLQFLKGAEQLAAKHFPLGEGTGTYGSDLSTDRELAAFNNAGLLGVYGFRGEGPQFSADNFLAHILGERGYLGLATWLLSLVALIYLVVISPLSNLPASLTVAAVALTPVAPVFRDVTTILLLLFPASMCLFFSSASNQPRSNTRYG